MKYTLDLSYHIVLPQMMQWMVYNSKITLETISKSEAVWSPQMLAMSFENLLELDPKPAQANETFSTDIKMLHLRVQYMLCVTKK